MVETFRFVMEFNDNEFIKVFYKELNDNYTKIRNTKCEVQYEEIKYRNLITDCLKILNPYRTPTNKLFENSSSLQQTSSDNMFRKYTAPEPTNTPQHQQQFGNTTPRAPELDLRPIIIDSFQEES